MSTNRQMTYKASPSLDECLTGRVGLRLPRKLMTITLAAAAAGITIAGCRGSDITGPSTENPPRASAHLLGGDEDNSPIYPASSQQLTPEEAEADPEFKTTVETTFPVTEAVYNVCRNELVVLNGQIRERLRIENDGLSLKFRLQSWKDTRGVYGTYSYDEDYWDDDSDSWKRRTRVVKYHNKQQTLDKFQVGPAEAPFRSEFESKMHLEREGPDPFYVKQLGDDLFVFVRQRVKIHTNGQVEMKNEFRTECK